MKILDPGHRYALRVLDDDGVARHQLQLVFVKREGDGYPGNVGHHSGTTTQEVLRALIDRTLYVDAQIPDPDNIYVIEKLRWAIFYLERRAAVRHGRLDSFIKVIDTLEDGFTGIESLPTCELCNHIGCEGTCRAA